MTARRYRGHWYVDFRFKRTRIRKRSPVDTRRGAEAYERQLREELMNPTPSGHQEVPRFDAFANEFMKTYVRSTNKPSEQRTKEYRLRVYIKPFFGDCRIDEIGVRQIEHFRAHLLDHERNPSIKTIRNILGVLSKLLRYAEEIELIEKAPRVRFPRVPEAEFDFLEFEEADRLLESARMHDSEYYAMLFVALRTGLRYGELCELRWPDLDLVAGRLLVKRSFVSGHVGTPKSGKGREVPLSPRTVEVLKEHRHLKGLVFSLARGQRITHRVAYRSLHRICRRAGLRLIGWHTLRHTFASHLVMRNRSLKEVQELLGHADYQQTLRYAHLAPSVKRAAVNVLDEPFETAEFGHYLGTSESSDSQVLRVVEE